MPYHVAILVSDNLLPDAPNLRTDAFERQEQMDKITAAFGKHDMQADMVRWRDASDKAVAYDAMLPLLVWDYVEGDNKHHFLTEMAKISDETLLLNDFKTLKWNSDKAYLDELGARGAPVIETVILDRVTETGIERAFETLGADKIVIKPRVGAGAWRQVLYTKNEAFPAKDLLPPAEAMVQAFLPSVQSEGEYSFLYFGGRFSHALVKTPKDGDYRIQSTYGGSETAYAPTRQEKDTARAVLDTLDFIPLYARIDLLRGLDGQLKLIELEMIEPYLYLPFAEGEGGDNKGALRLAEALKAALDARE